MGDFYGHVDAGGRPVVSFGDYGTAIAEGAVYGHVPWVKLGYNGDLDTGAAGEVVEVKTCAANGHDWGSLKQWGGVMRRKCRRCGVLDGEAV